MENHSMEHMHPGSTTHTKPSSFAPCDLKHLDDPNRPASCGVHNQMMVGEQTIYLSHLPMFMFDPNHHEHNFQVILEVTLSGPGHAQESYVSDRRNHSDVRMYTMSPGPFEMIELDPQRPSRTSLTGNVFRGHLERDSEVIIPGATAEIAHIVYFHQFDPKAKPLDQLEYLLFGKAPDLFLAHIITRPPDFDQILSVRLAGDAPSDEDLRRGIRVTIPGRRNDLHTRIKSGERVMGQGMPAGAQAGQPLALQLEAGVEFYFEEGELRDPMTMRQTPEERSSGF